MARRKFRNQRYEPVTDRSYQEYVLATPAPQTSRDELMRLVRGGEDTFLELKVKLSNPDRIAQAIVALANTRGGLIVFGVNDNMRVEGVDDAEEVRDELKRICREEVVPPLLPYIDIVSFDNGRRIVALDVEGKARSLPYRTRDGRFFIRLGAEKREATREELSAILDENPPVRYENLPVLSADLQDIDDAYLWSFLQAFEGDAFAGARNFVKGEVLAEQLLLAAPVGQAAEPVPTVAGLLLFGKQGSVAELLPRASILAVRFNGDPPASPRMENERIESVELTGNLHTLYESAWKFVKRYCDVWETRPRNFPGRTADMEAPVKARANYHRAALAEAISNALAHRDLALRDTPTRLHIYDHAIDIINPRRTAGFLPAAQRALRYGVPQRLNPQLAALFNSPAYGLDLPHGGLPMLLRESRLFSGQRPRIQAINDEFSLRLYGV